VTQKPGIIRSTNRFRPLRAGLFVVIITSLTCISTSLILLNDGHGQMSSRILAVLVSIAVGVVAAAVLLGIPYDRQQNHWRQYIKKMACFKVVDREAAFEDLRLDRDDLLGEISQQVHRILVNSFSHFAEASRLKRTMDQTIQNKVFKATTHLDRIAHTDALTGLRNRRALETITPSLIEACIGSKHDLLCLLVDMDYFKQINDTLGHDEGDQILQHLAAVLKSVLRETDLAFRLGGDEFVIIFPDLNPKVITPITERLQKRFQKIPWSADERSDCKKPTLSMGIASLMQIKPQNLPSLLKVADQSLYAAKQAGRGCAFFNEKKLGDATPSKAA